MEREEFSVYLFMPNQHFPVARFVSVERAMQVAQKAVKDHGALYLERVIVTDGGDHTVFEWTRGKGVTWPTNAS